MCRPFVEAHQFRASARPIRADTNRVRPDREPRGSFEACQANHSGSKLIGTAPPVNALPHEHFGGGSTNRLSIPTRSVREELRKRPGNPGQNARSAHTAPLRPQHGKGPAPFKFGDRPTAVATTWQDPHETQSAAQLDHSARGTHTFRMRIIPCPNTSAQPNPSCLFQICAPWGKILWWKSFPGERGTSIPCFSERN
jgi:hypothetical protein